MPSVVFKTYSDDGEIKQLEMDTDELRLNRMKRRPETWENALRRSIDAKLVKILAITLTYDTEGTLVPASDWSPKHISIFLDRLNKRKGLSILAYAWVVEVQERGVPHYHIILMYKGSVPYPDKSGLWQYGMSNIRFKVRSPYYLTTYLKKSYQKDFSRLPAGARAYAVSIRDKSLHKYMTSLLLPEHIRERYLIEGKQALEDLLLPMDMRSVFVGNAVTESYAEMLSNP